MKRLELSDMMVGLREELKESQAKAQGEDLQFNVDTIDLEVQVTVSKEAKAGGKAKWRFWVLSEIEGEVGAQIAKETIQTVRIRLSPAQSTLISGDTSKPTRE